MPERKNAGRGFLDTLVTLQEMRRDGVLRFERGRFKRQLVIELGMLSFAESNVPAEHLAHILVKMGKITSRDVQDVSRQMKAGKSIEEALLATKKIDGAALEEGAREQALNIISAILLWEDYDMRFFTGENLVRRQVPLRIPLVSFADEAARRTVGFGKLPSELLKLEGLIAPSEFSKSRQTSRYLDKDAAILVSQIRDETRVEEVLASTQFGEVKPEDLIRRLLLLGVIELRNRPLAQAGGTGATLSAEEIQLQQTLEMMLQRFQASNHYDILGVKPEASDDEIRNAYHDLAKEYHPDRFQSTGMNDDIRSAADKVFTFVTGAYTVLANPVARTTYDESLAKAQNKIEGPRGGAEQERDQMAETVFHAGRAALANQDYEKAAGYFRECVWLRPEVARYQHHLGVALAQLPKFIKQAEQHLLKSIELDNLAVDSRIALGKVYLKVSLPRRAEQQFLDALHWDAENREARMLLDSMSKPKRGDSGFLRKLKGPFST